MLLKIKVLDRNNLEVRLIFNPDHIYWGILLLYCNWGGGGGQFESFACLALLIGHFFSLELKLEVFFMTKAVPKRDVCFIRPVC